MRQVLSKSISELEKWKWKGAIPSESDSYTEYRFYTLHDKPISELDFSDIRFLITQNSGLEYLVPIAIEKLREDLFLETEYYPGDLFYSLLLINNSPNYWETHPEEKDELIKLYGDQKQALGGLDLTDELIQKIKEGYKDFLNK
jgi:hypothetical protein